MNTDPSPGGFQVGRSYRVRRSFHALRDEFREGEILRYTGSAYSRYDGITGHFFMDEKSGGRTWDVRDDEPGDAWAHFFAVL